MATDRRIQILDAAAHLFAERGFHGVSVHDIGAACGITGPALYRHFAGKDDLLAQSLTAISERHVAEAADRVARHAGDDAAALASLIDWHVDFALTHPELIVIQDREWANLTRDAQRRVRDLQLRYVDTWVAVLRRLHPDLDPPEARAAVQAMFGLLNSTPHSARVGDDVMRRLLTRMAVASFDGL